MSSCLASKFIIIKRKRKVFLMWESLTIDKWRNSSVNQFKRNVKLDKTSFSNIQFNQN